MAALDLGTNTFLMLVARADGAGGIEVAEDHCRTPRLGAGLARTGRMSAEAIERGLAVLAEFRARLDRLHVDAADVRAVGTAVFRRAENAEAFVAAARRACGFEIEVLGESEEARLGFGAVVCGGADPRSRVVDVGGGSTEIVCEGGRPRVSAPVGAVVLTERWQGDLAGRAFDDAAWAALREDAARGIAALGELADAGACGSPVVVLGGSGVNLACLDGGFECFDPARAEGRRVATSAAAIWAERLRRLALAERLTLPIEPERGAILPAGLACLAAALEVLGAEVVSVTGRGLRFGIARELLEARHRPR